MTTDSCVWARKVYLRAKSDPWKPLLEAKVLEKRPLNWNLQKEKIHQGTQQFIRIYMYDDI